ncbi:MAG: acyltransferase [Oscillospiraceae bacterium]|nr:acyltransferase [Oscillospiraceae bacterium]
MKERKNTTIQNMRAIAIILVVFQHAIVALISEPIAMTIAAVCVGIDVKVFMFISGYLFQQNIKRYKDVGTKKFIKDKAVALLLPYLFWECLLYFGVWVIYNGPAFLNKLTPVIQKFGFTQLTIPQIIVSLITFNNSYLELYWFLYALFVVFILQYVTGDFLKSIKGIAALFVLLPLFMLVGENVYIVKKIAVGLLMFSAGRYFKDKEVSLESVKGLYAIIAVAIWGITYALPDISGVLYIEQLWYIVISIIRGLTGTVMVVWIAVQIERICHRYIRNAVHMIGDYSLSIYLLHNPWVIRSVSMLIPSEGGM